MSNVTNKQSSDSKFYLVMLAVIVGMGFYVSYDMEKRYGATDSIAEAQSQPEVTPMVVETAPVESVVVKTEATVEQVPEAKPIVKAETVAEVVETKPAVEPTAPAAPVNDTARTISEAVVTEAVEAVETVTKFVPVPVPVPVFVPEKQEVASEPAPIAPEQPVQPYQNYGQPYQGGYNYQPQNPYNSPYGNYYQQPYGYNPYQQPYNAPSE